MRGNKYVRGIFLTIIYLMILGLTYLVFGKPSFTLGIVAILTISKLSKDDFIISPKREFIKLTLGFTLVAIMAQIANSNIYLSIVINAIVIYCIGALNLDRLNKGYYNTFLIVYVFMLIFKTTNIGLIMRIATIVLCVSILMFTKMYIFKVKYIDVKIELLQDIIQIMMKKIENIKTDQDTRELSVLLYMKIAEVNNIINSTRRKDNFISKKDRSIFDCITALQKLNIMLQKINYNKIVCESIDKFMGEVYDILSVLEKCIIGKYSISKSSEELNNILNNLKNSDVYEKKVLKGVVQFLIITVENFIESGNVGISGNKENIRNRLIDFFVEKNEGYYFNLRMMAAVTSTYFISKELNVIGSVCLILSAVLIVQIASEEGFVKPVIDISGTVLGGMIYILIYRNINFENGKLICIILAVYLMSLIKDYNKLTAFAIMCVMGIEALSDKSIIIVEKRLFLIIIGIVVGLIFNMIIRPYKFKSMFIKTLDSVRQNDKKLYSLLKDENFKREKQVRDIMIDNSLKVDYLDNISGDNKKFRRFWIYHFRIATNEAFLLKLINLKGRIDKDNFLKDGLMIEIEEDILNITKLKAEEI